MHFKFRINMKKIVCITLLAICATLNNAYATDPTFQKAQTLIQEKKFDDAYKELDRLAKAGNAQATYNLAFMSIAGQGTPRNPDKALELYNQAANKGYAPANYALAQIYANGGLGQKQDLAKSKSYLDKAAAQGLEEAIIEQAVLLFAKSEEQTDKQALNKLDPLIKKGNLAAIHAKAVYDISRGLKNQNKDAVQNGIKSFESLARQNYIPSLIALANMQIKGDLVPQNLIEAKKIYTALAEQNVPQARESIKMIDQMLNEKTAPSSKSKNK